MNTRSARRARTDSALPELAHISDHLTPLLLHAGRGPKSAHGAISSRVRMGALSSVAGFVDAAGFVTLAGLFPAHITGEMVGSLAALSAGRQHEQLGRVTVLGAFLLSVVAGALVSRSLRERGRSPLGALLGLVALSLVCFSLAGSLLPLWLPRATGLPHLLEKCSIVGAMGLQNVIMRHALTSSCPTTVMTGNLTQFIIELVELSLTRWSKQVDHSALHAKHSIRLRVIGTALGAFLASALLGAWLTLVIGALGVLLPALVVAWLAYREIMSPTAPARTGTLF